MNLLISMIATTTLLLVSGALLSAGRRRRRPKVRPLAADELAALEHSVGERLAALVAAAVRLRDVLEDVAASGREMLVVEQHLGSSPRRPLWRQIDDANFGHELDSLRRIAQMWLRDFDELPTAERGVVDELELDVEPVRALVARIPESEHGVDRHDELALLHRQIGAAIACLRRLESDISSYRGGGYR